MSRLGHDAYEELRREHFSALRAAVAKHNGTEVKTTGDGLMVRFDSAAQALACAVAMQQSVDGVGQRRPPFGPSMAKGGGLSSGLPLASAKDEAVRIRVGIPAGEATDDGGDLYGLPVVEAARLCTAAGRGRSWSPTSSA